MVSFRFGYLGANRDANGVSLSPKSRFLTAKQRKRTSEVNDLAYGLPGPRSMQRLEVSHDRSGVLFVVFLGE